MSNSPENEERLVIKINSNVSRGKAAAAAVHAALNHYGIDHGAVICLGANSGTIERECTSVIHDAGRTEVEPGTTTAGIYDHRNASNEFAEGPMFAHHHDRTEIAIQQIDAALESDDVVAELAKIRHTDGISAPYPHEGYLQGSWDLIQDLLLDGTITDEEYEELAKIK